MSKGKKKAPKETLHFTARKFCYVELTVSPPNHPVLGIRSLLGVLLANLGLEFPDGVALLPLDKSSKLKPITSASAIPEKWSRIKKYIEVTNDEEQMKKQIKGKKDKLFKGVIRVGSLADLDEGLLECGVDLAQVGVMVEVKRLQVKHSRKDLLLPLGHKDADLQYAQDKVSATLVEAHRERITKDRTMTPMAKGYEVAHVFHLIVHMGYPPNSFENRPRGTRLRYNATSKQMLQVEFDATNEERIMAVWKPWKLKLRKYLGSKVFPLWATPETAPAPSQRKYKEFINKHVAATESSSSLELRDIEDVDYEYSFNLPTKAGATPTVAKIMSVRSILMEHTVPGGNETVFHAVVPTCSGCHEGVFPNTALLESEATKMAHHVAAFCMYQLLFKYEAEAADIERFINQCFTTEATTVALQYSDYDQKTGVVSISPECGALAGEDDDLAELRKETWIDMSILELDNAEVTKGVKQAGILFNHDDATSYGSMDTNAYHLHRGLDTRKPPSSYGGLQAGLAARFTPLHQPTRASNGQGARATNGTGSRSSTVDPAAGAVPPGTGGNAATPPDDDSVVGSNK